jgi:hypothetical protein
VIAGHCPLGKRKERLARLVDRRIVGIVMNDYTDTSGQLGSNAGRICDLTA